VRRQACVRRVPASWPAICPCFPCRCGKHRITAAFDIGKTNGKRIDLVKGEGDMRHVEPGTQHIAYPGFAIDRQTRGLKVRDVAVNGRRTDLENPGQIRGTAHAPGAHFVHQSEKPFRASHLCHLILG
jgi:hypothetical protein